MNDDSLRSVDICRMGAGRFKATNARGGVLPISSGDDPDFTPVELLLAALAGCGAIEVASVTGRSAEPESFDVRAEGHKVSDEDGSHLTRLRIVFDVEFPPGSAGDQARAALPDALARARDAVSTVSRTVALGSPVVYE